MLKQCQIETMKIKKEPEFRVQSVRGEDSRRISDDLRSRHFESFRRLLLQAVHFQVVRHEHALAFEIEAVFLDD